MKVRSWHFIVSGAVGGMAGFVLMELCSVFFQEGGTRTQNVLQMGLYFAGFGLAVGSSLGFTEGFVLKKRSRRNYGLIMGLILGAVGGFVGGLVGQGIYGLAPLRYALRSDSDIAIALDSSGSMRHLFFWGNDPWGQRKKAARHLVERLGSTDRIAIVDFDETAQVLFPLAFVDSSDVRKAAQSAIDRIDDDGGTSLDSGLMASIEELARNRTSGRRQHIIFLTDGVGQYSPDTARRAGLSDIAVHTIGLGDEVDSQVLGQIAQMTGGHYHPVERASELIEVFESILTENIAMVAGGNERNSEVKGELLTSPILLLLLRVLSWGVMGLAIGLGQGIRENTREDLRACAIGGLIGGLIGGALFDYVASLVQLGGGTLGRGVADILVGACIGGSMRLAQEQIVLASEHPPTTLLRLLPGKTTGRLG